MGLVWVDLRAAWRTWAGVGVVFLAMQASTVLLALITVSAQRYRDGISGAEAVQAATLVNAPWSFGIFVVLAVIAVTASSVELVVSQRRGALARWALAGATPRQLVAGVLVQLLLVALITAGVGVAVALATLGPVLGYVADAGIGPAHVPAVRSPAAVAVGVLLGSGLALLGGWRQARAISRVSPVEALRQAARPSVGMTRARWGLTMLLIGLLVTAFGVMPQAASIDDAASLSFLVAVLATLLVAAAAPIVLPAFTSLWTALLPVRSVAWFLARRSIIARLPRLSGVVTPLALAVALFLGLQTISATLAASVATSTGQAGVGGARTEDLVITIGLPLMVAVAGAVGGLIMSGRQRDADLGIAGVVGATPGQRAAQAALEATVLSLTGLLLGTLAAATGLLSVVIGLGNVLETVVAVFPLVPLLVISAFAWTVAILAALVPAVSALRRPPHRVVAQQIAE